MNPICLPPLLFRTNPYGVRRLLLLKPLQNPSHHQRSTMEFWGVEIKGDKAVSVEPGMGQVIHLSQATLAELKKVSEPVMLYAGVDGKKFVIGVLTADKFPQLSFDLVFEKEFTLSHNLKNGTVHLSGYKSFMDGPEFSDLSGEEEDDIPLEFKQNGVAALSAATKAKVAAPAVKKTDKVEEESDDDDDDSDDSDEVDSDGDDEEMEIGNADDDGDDDDDSEEESSEEDDETPVKSVDLKKRPAPATKKTPEGKKAKLETPKKTDGKKASAHADTPRPVKGAGKNDKSNVKTPKSGSNVTCDSCKKSFKSEKALESHSKAKHATK